MRERLDAVLAALGGRGAPATAFALLPDVYGERYDPAFAAWPPTKGSPISSTSRPRAPTSRRVAEAWRPYRSWVSVLLRLNADDASRGSREP